MDFDPHSIKWQCCCCSLPSGMRLLAATELFMCLITAAFTIYNIFLPEKQKLTVFEICLIGLMLFVSFTSILLIVGVQRHSSQLIYPSLFARGLCVLFLAIFGVSTVFAHSGNSAEHTTRRYYSSNDKKSNFAHVDEPALALRLVLFVFAMLFITVIIFYGSYLIVRLIRYEQNYAKLKDRRSSLIQAAMIAPDYPSPHQYSSRRASSA